MEGLRSLMEDTGGPRVVAAETNLEDAAGAVAELQPNLLLLDKEFGAPALSACVRRLRDADPRAAVIVWGRSMSEREALGLMQSGVSGVVRKTASLLDLADCVRAVASGGKWMDCAPVLS
jgi:DNA-binding NarL/FixJ family response regulator